MASDYSGARKLPTGWAHLLNIRWNGDDTDWENRVLRWGEIRAGVSKFNRAYVGGMDNLRLSDTDQALWGSFKGPSGTNPLFTTFAILSTLAGPDGTFSYESDTAAKFGEFRFGELRFGDLLLSGVLAEGRTIEIQSSENAIELSLYDKVDIVDKAKFVWDYVGLSFSSGGNVYGTVKQILNATTFVVEEASDGTMRQALNTIITPEDMASYDKEWKRLGNLGAFGTDTIYPGDILKFGPNSIADADAGSLLLQSPSYVVNAGAFRVSSGGTWGTIEVSRPLVNISPGDYFYKRKPLIYEGNPAEIVRQMMIGSNTTVQMSAANISGSHYAAATAACSPMIFRSVIVDEGEGAVLAAVKEISEPLEAQFCLDRSGRWIWQPYRPRNRSNIDVPVDYYDAIAAGTDNIIGEVTFKEALSSVFTDVRFKYGVDPLDSGLADFSGQYELQRPTTSAAHNGFRSMATITTKWVQDENEAVVIANRFLRNHATAAKEITLTTSLYGIESDLLKVVDLSHRTGSYTNAAFSISEYRINLDEGKVTLVLEDISDLRNGNGWGRFTAFDEGTSVIGPHVVTATSASGWGWPVTAGAGTQGTIHINLAPLGVTVVLYDTSGSQPTTIGAGGDTHFITIGSEIMKVTSDKALATKVVVRALETTDEQYHSVGAGWMAWPMDANGDIIPCYNGTEISGTRIYGTVHEIKSGTFGTVFRWF